MMNMEVEIPDKYILRAADILEKCAKSDGICPNDCPLLNCRQGIEPCNNLYLFAARFMRAVINDKENK